MKHLFIYLICFVSTSSAFAQPTIQWKKTLGGSQNDEANCIQSTSDGGYIVAGLTNSTNGDFPAQYGADDVWVAKMNEVGAVQWQVVFGGSHDEEPTAIRQTLDGGYIVVGSTDSDDEMMSGNHGQVDLWVVKIDSTGSIEWKRVMGGSLWDIAWDVVLDREGGYLVIGKTESSDGDVTENHGNTDYWAIKLDAIGITQWQKTYGGNSLDIARTGGATTDGGYLLTGICYSYNGTITDHKGGSDVWLVKIDAQGAVAWSKSLGGSAWDAVYAIEQTLDGGYIMTGSTESNDGDVSSNHGSSDIWVVKTDASGAIEWERSLGGNLSEYGSAVEQTADAGYLIGGSTQSINGDAQGNNGGQDVWLLKLDASGTLIWQQTFGGLNAEYCFDVALSSDQGIVFVGSATSNGGDVGGVHGLKDGWMVKLGTGSVGVKAVAIKPLAIFPNPTQSAVFVQFDSETTAMPYVIFNLQGQELGQGMLDNYGTVDLSQWPGGWYVIRATTASGVVYVGKVEKVE